MTDKTEAYYSPSKNVIIDLITPETGLTYWGKQTAEQIRETHPDAIALSFDEASERYQRPFIEPVSEITEEKFCYWLEVLVPEDWQHGHNCESFKLIERTCGDITTICASLGKRYFVMADSYKTPHAEIMRRVRAFIDSEAG